ncbi:membrane protein [Candidatus Magnetomorum sp. HK-1]|nr:membrane protein [Candidatus Magnetomorum sp. HK-1]
MTIIHIILGICLLSLGIAGIASNWWAVLDFVSVIIPLIMLFIGVISILAGINATKNIH